MSSCALKPRSKSSYRACAMMVPAEKISAGFCRLPPVAFPANLPYFTRNMKLLTYDAANGRRAGVVVDGQIDIATLLKEQDGRRDSVPCWNCLMTR